MRLKEFADPKEYIPPAAEAEELLNHLLRLWPGHSPDDVASSVPRIRKCPSAERKKLFDAL